MPADVETSVLVPEVAVVGCKSVVGWDRGLTASFRA